MVANNLYEGSIEDFQKALGELPDEQLKKTAAEVGARLKEGMGLVKHASEAGDKVAVKQVEDFVRRLLAYVKVIEIVIKRRAALAKRLQELKKM